VAELMRRDDPADQVLDQRLGHTAIDVVVRHLVADTVGRPAQSEFGQIPGPQHDAAALVGQPEQVVSAQTGLNVLESDVIHLLAAGERMPDLGEHQFGGGLDVDGLERHPQGVGEPDGIGLGALARREPGQCERENVTARPVFSIHCARGDDQGVGRVEATGEPEDHLRVVECPQPLLQAGHLDVVGLVAILLQTLRIRWHKRKPLDFAAQADITRRRIEPKFHLAE